MELSLNRLDTIDNIVKELAESGPTNIIVWYFGPNGLKTDCVRYYKKLFNRLREIPSIDKIYLYDLAAWGALFDKNKNIFNYNKNVDIVNQSYHSRFAALASNDFFKWLTSEKEPPVQNFVDQLLARKELYEPSKMYPDTGIKISEVFVNDQLKFLGTRDTSKVYSGLQYLEAFYLVYYFAKQGLHSLTFLLPNDESKYYQHSHFNQDLNSFLHLMHITEKINIEFHFFEYTKSLKSRPYYSGKNITIQLDMADVG